MNRVVITGAGVVSSLGKDLSSNFNSLSEGKSGISKIEFLNSDRLSIKIGGQIKNYNPDIHFTKQEKSIYDKFTQFALIATKQAVLSSGWEFQKNDNSDIGVILGTAGGGLQTQDENYRQVYEEGKNRVHPLIVPKLMNNAAASNVSIKFNVQGPSFTIASACSSSNHAMGQAFNLIRSGVIKAAITGAVDSGMPVITVNSGTQEQSESMGAMLHIGQPEFEAGRQAGVMAKADGVTDFVCFNHQMGNIPLTDRCAGYAAGLGIELGDRMVDIGGDPVEAKNRVFAYLKAHPDTPSILTLGPNGGNPTLQALEELGLAGDIYYGSFELSDEMIVALKSGVLQWSIDQQQFFQGYLAANLMTNHIRYGVTVPHHINSGPGFTTKDNIGLVESLAGTFR